MKKLLKPALIIIAFIVIIKLALRSEKEIDKKDGIRLNNNVVFGGIVTGLKVSGNHNFGVISLRIAAHGLPVFNPAPAKERLFPYKLQNGIAEVYDLVPSDLGVGDSVYINSAGQILYC